MIESGSVRKYLIYAVGEILLVMMGILLALQVNNWNENRKVQTSETKSLISLKEEFLKNQSDLQEHIIWKQEVRSQWDIFLTTISNEHLPPEERAVRRPVASFANYIISNSTLNSLLASGKIDNLNNNSLKYVLTTWEDIVEDYQQFQQMHSDFFTSELKPYERSLFPEESNSRYGFDYPFSGFDSKIELHMKAYNDMTYQNILLGNFYWINIQLRRIKELKETMDQIIELLEKEIDLKNKGM